MVTFTPRKIKLGDAYKNTGIKRNIWRLYVNSKGNIAYKLQVRLFYEIVKTEGSLGNKKTVSLNPKRYAVKYDNKFWIVGIAKNFEPQLVFGNEIVEHDI